MINISDLLDLQQIRNVLTVSPADLPDNVLNGYGLEDDVEAALDKRLGAWRALVDDKHIRSLRLYTKYKAASLVALTAPVFVLKKSTDGSNEGQRSDRDGFLWLAGSLSGRADVIMDDLLEELGMTVNAGQIDLVGKSIPSRDPIVEPRDNVS